MRLIITSDLALFLLMLLVGSAAAFTNLVNDLKGLEKNLISLDISILPEVERRSHGQMRRATQNARGLHRLHGHFSEIQETSHQAKDHLVYLEEVVKTIRSHLELKKDQPLAPSLKQHNVDRLKRKDPAEVRACLSSIEQARTAAQGYLKHLNAVADDVEAKMLQTFAADNSSKDLLNLGYVRHVEKTAQTAKAYLIYLRDCTVSIEAYLAEPKSSSASSKRGTPTAILPREEPRKSSKLTKKKARRKILKVTSKPMTSSYLDSIESTALARTPTRSASPKDRDYLSSLSANQLTKTSRESTKKNPPRGKPKVTSNPMSSSYLDTIESIASASRPRHSAPPQGRDYLSSLGASSLKEAPPREEPHVKVSGDVIFPLLVQFRMVRHAATCFNYIMSTNPTFGDTGEIRRRSLLAAKLTASQREEFKELFQLIDSDNSGTIELLEVKRLMESAGEVKTDEELLEMINKGDVSVDGNTSLGFADFMGIMAEAEIYNLFTETFKALDPNNTGYVMASELDRVLCGMRDLISNDRTTIIDVADTDMQIDYEQFSKMLLGTLG